MQKSPVAHHQLTGAQPAPSEGSPGKPAPPAVTADPEATRPGASPGSAEGSCPSRVRLLMRPEAICCWSSGRSRKGLEEENQLYPSKTGSVVRGEGWWSNAEPPAPAQGRGAATLRELSCPCRPHGTSLAQRDQLPRGRPYLLEHEDIIKEWQLDATGRMPWCNPPVGVGRGCRGESEGGDSGERRIKHVLCLCLQGGGVPAPQG